MSDALSQICEIAVKNHRDIAVQWLRDRVTNEVTGVWMHVLVGDLRGHEQWKVFFKRGMKGWRFGSAATPTRSIKTKAELLRMLESGDGI